MEHALVNLGLDLEVRELGPVVNRSANGRHVARRRDRRRHVEHIALLHLLELEAGAPLDPTTVARRPRLVEHAAITINLHNRLRHFHDLVYII